MSEKDKILVVDDNPDNLLVMSKVLGNGIPNIEIITYHEPEKVMDYLQTSNISVAILDVQMPGMTGITLCNLIKTSEITKHIPVMLVTANNAPSALKAQGLEVGADDFISRPMNNIELIARVKVALRISRAEVGLRKKAEVIESKLAVITDNLPILISHIDKNLKYISANKFYCDISDVKESLIGKNVLDVIGKEAFDRASFYMQKAIAGEFVSFENRYTNNDGRLIIFETNYIPHVVDGEVESFFVLGIDVTVRKQAEDALRESDARHSAMIANMGDVIAIIDKDWINRYKSPNIERLFGWLPKEVLGESIWKHIHPDDLPRMQSVFISLLEKPNSIISDECRYQCKDGSFKWIELTATNLLSVSAINGLLFNYHDISERKQFEKELLKSEEELKHLIQHLHAGVVVHSSNTEIIMANEQAANLLGVTLDQLIGSAAGNNAWSFFREDDTKVPVEEYPVASVLATRKPIHNLLLGISHPLDNGKVWVLVNAFPELDSSGEIRQIVVTFTDISERKQLEEELTRLFTGIEQTEEIICITDTNGTIQYINLAIEKVTGFTPKELIGKNPRFLKSGEHDKEFYQEMWKVLTNGETWKGQFINKKKDGTLYTEEAVISPVTDSSGQIINYVAVKRDISKEIEMEEHLRRADKMDAIGHLAGGIAHDFNNILTGIFGNLLLAKEQLSKDHPSFNLLEKSGESMDRATHLTSQLLTFAKGGNPIKEDVSLEKMVKETVKFDLSGSKVKPVFRVDKDLRIANVDQGQMQQVFSNFTINADQAMPDGGKLYVSLENADVSKNMIPELEQGKYIKCTIRDEGIGMPQNQLTRIFDPYYTTKQTGSGLGLATVYSIIKKHDGHISVDSKLEKGTTFTIYLPASESTQVVVQKSAETEGLTSYVKQSARILVLDDEAMICELVSAILKVVGLTVATAQDGNQAIKMYRQSLKDKKPFDALIMDLTIPGGVGGKEAISELLKINPEVKCIVSSGYANDPIMADYAEFGFKGIVTKPYSPENLLEELGRVLKD